MKVFALSNAQDWIKLAQAGVQAVIRKNQYGRSFYTLYGNTFSIKGQLQNLGFKFFKGTWSKPVDALTDSDKATLGGMGLDLSVLDVPVETVEPEKKTENPAQPNQPNQPAQSTETPAAEKSAVDQELDKMKFGVELAMKQEGSGKVKGLLSFIDRMIERVAGMVDEAAQSEFVKNFMAFSAKFHDYSFHNQMLIWVQNPHATYVRGFKQWMELGREVTNWDNPIVIIAPRFKKVEGTQTSQTEGGDTSEPAQRTMVSFMAANVYDISDTQPIPNWEQMKGKKPFEAVSWRKDPNEAMEEITALVNATIDWAKASNIDVDFEKMAAEMGGFSAGGKIRINDTYQGINLFSTAVHEVAHELLHWQSTEESKRSQESRVSSRQEKEIDAETTAFIVLQHYGFETADTPNYLALWKAKGEDVKKRREHINKSVKAIVQAIDSQIAKTTVEEVTAKGKKMKIKISKSQWEGIGKKAGWIRTAVIPDDGIADGGTPYTDEEMNLMEEKEPKRVSFSFGTTPEEVIKERVGKQTPSGYPMHIKNQAEWAAIAKAVNQGIDSRLEGFTRSTFDSKTGQCLIHPAEMTIFLRRLYEAGDEESWGLRSAILETLGVEEI